MNSYSLYEPWFSKVDLATLFSSRDRNAARGGGGFSKRPRRFSAPAGITSASITEIAVRAEFAAGTIYLYFSDKADLYGNCDSGEDE